MQTLTIGAYRATLAPTRDVGAFQAKLAKCNGKSRRLPLRDTRTKSEFPRFRPGMSTADYVRAFESGHLVPWQWAQLNDAPCTLYSGEDTCETLPDGFDTWEDFDAAQSSSTAAESAPADAEPVDAAEPVAPDDAIAAAIVAGAEPDAPAPSARAEPYPGSEPQRMADAMRARVAPTADALREAAAELEARAARVPTERADDYRGAAAMLRADADAAPGIVPGFASRGARMLQAAIARSAARGIEVGAGGAPLPTHSQTAPVADPLPTHSAADDDGFAHRVATVAAFISSGRNPTRAFSNCLEMYDGAAVAVALMRRAEKRPDSKMAANIWRYLCRAATESSAAEQPADMSLAEWSRVLIQRAQSESNAMRADPLPSESETDPLPADSQDAPDVAKWRAELRSVEDAILRAAPARYSNGRHGCDIEAAARSRSVAADLKRQRKYLRASLRGARMMADAVQPAPVASAPPPVESRPLTPAAERTFATDEADERASVRPWPDPLPVESAPLPGKSAPETVMLSHVLGALQCIAPDSIPDAAMLAREADRIEATAERMRDAMPNYSATCATVAHDLRALADSATDPLPGDTKPEALDDDETIPAPLDGLDVAELDGLAEFERAGGEVKPTAPAYRDDAPRATPTPSLRISPSDPRARIPARFAPVYLLQA